jgi:hypothetical protein
MVDERFGDWWCARAKLFKWNKKDMKAKGGICS